MKDFFRKKPSIDPMDVGRHATKAASTGKATIVGLFRAIQRAWDGFFERRVPMMAAGLAFYFLLGFIPFVFLVAATSGYFLRTNPELLHQIDASILTLLPPGIGERILVEIQGAAANWQAFGLLGLVSLVLVSMGLFDALDEGINAVMGTHKKVGFFTGRIISLAYIVGAILFFSVAAVAGYTLNLMETLPFFQENPAVTEMAGKGFSAWVFAAFMLGLYMTLPVKTPKLFHAVVISLAVTGAWAVLQKLGTYVTAGLSRRQAIYGALGGAAVFLTWMYLLGLLILLGARILDFWRGTPDPPPTDIDEYM
jgi:membrane protein